jgi:hypothetical protein
MSLDSMSWRCSRSLGQFGAPHGMSLYETSHDSSRIAMQAMELLPRFLGLGQASPVFLVLLQGRALQLLP